MHRQELRFRRLGHRHDVPRVPASYLVSLRGFVEPLPAELPDRLERPEPDPAINGLHARHQAVVDERRQPVEEAQVQSLGTDRLRRLQREAAGEDRDPREHATLLVVEQVVAPPDGGTKGLLSLGKVPRVTLEQ